MKLGLYPFPSCGDIPENLTHIARGAALAKEQDVDLLAFHECALCGYPPLETDIQRITPKAVAAGLDRVSALAREYAMHIAVGTVRFDGEKRFNSVMVYAPDGSLMGCYDKQGLWGWDCDHFAPGTQSGLFEIRSLKVGFRICFDVRFPEPFRQLYRFGADLCVVCFSDAAKTPDADRYGLISAHLRTRAVENVMPVAAVNTLTGYQTAPCCVIDRDGKILAETAAGTQQLLVWTFDPSTESFGAKGRRVNSDRFLEESLC